MKRGIAGMIVALASASACASKQPTTPVAVGSVPEEAVPPAPTPPPRPDGPLDDVGLLSAKAELVASLDFQQARASVLWTQLVEPRLAGVRDQLEKFGASCGFDPLASIRRVTVAIDEVGATSPTGTIVVHGYARAKILGCFDQMKQVAEAGGSKMTRQGDVILLTDTNGLRSTLGFVAADTMLIAMGGDPAAYAEYARDASPLKSSATFRDLTAKIDPHRTLWLVMRGDAKAFDGLARSGVKLKALFGSLAMTDGVTVALRARLISPDAATQLAAMANGQLGSLKGFVDRLEVTTDATDVVVDAAVSLDKLKALLSLAGGGSP